MATGSLEWFCVYGDVSQAGADASWFSIGNAIYTSGSDTKYTQSYVGPAASGYQEVSKRLTLPGHISNAKILLDGLPITVAEIPANAVVTKITVHLSATGYAGLNYEISEIGHDNAFLPAIDADDLTGAGLVPGDNAWDTLTAEYIIDPGVTPISVQDVASQATTNYGFTARYLSGTLGSGSRPWLAVRYMRLLIEFTEAALDDMGGSAALALTADGTIQKVRDLIGSASMELTGAAALVADRILSANVDLLLTGYGEISEDMVDCTGLTEFSVEATATMQRDILLSGQADLAVEGAGEIQLMGVLTGSADLEFSLAGLLRGDGNMFVGDGGCDIQLTPTGALGRTANMTGTAALTCSAAAYFAGDMTMTGTVAIAVSGAGTLQRQQQLAAAPEFSFSVSGTLDRTAAMTGTAALQLVAAGILTRLSEAEALDENTLVYQPPSRAVIFPPEERALEFPPWERTHLVPSRSRTIVLAGQQRN